ncbi:hypothetical protein FN846DRAFT_894902 [Sphaerosporella brunnea]|uniref:Uncharacterized protein n=1 Tax=Sphaerosporella brunnea TaxID=1250544 RepID=A0A5J5EH75_9PEZI|nr:hypothetical protein FN846DRAFT_894901 [Sphaerosporella brunnea]KAA8894632.1 hypothetical protein FN846DRAFT_894902 [Sphaerosporella brunnea]
MQDYWVKALDSGVAGLVGRDLPRMGVELNAIPAMSTESERMLSGSIHNDRSASFVRGDVIEGIECLKSGAPQALVYGPGSQIEKVGHSSGAWRALWAPACHAAHPAPVGTRISVQNAWSKRASIGKARLIQPGSDLAESRTARSIGSPGVTPPDQLCRREQTPWTGYHSMPCTASYWQNRKGAAEPAKTTVPIQDRARSQIAKLVAAPGWTRSMCAAQLYAALVRFARCPRPGGPLDSEAEFAGFGGITVSAADGRRRNWGLDS